MSNESQRPSDAELAQLYYVLAKLEKQLAWRKACFFVRFMLGTGVKVSEAQHVTFGDISLDHDPPVIFISHRPKGAQPRYVQVRATAKIVVDRRRTGEVCSTIR